MASVVPAGEDHVPNLAADSTLTNRYQTTARKISRRALKLGMRDEIQYTIRPNVEAVLGRMAPAEGEDPLLWRFLDFLAQDIAVHPDRLGSVDAGLVQRIQSLADDIEVERDASLSAYVDEPGGKPTRR